MQEETFKLTFFAWLEIPYFIGINYESVYPADYRPDIKVQLRIKFRNDLLRIMTSNRWTYDDYRERLENQSRETLFVPRYATKDELSSIKELVKRQNLPYLHIEQLETVVELSTEFEVPKCLYEAITKPDFVPEVLPCIGFFNTEVLPKIASVVNTYRVATLPALRYSVHPVSENLIGKAFIQIQDSTGKILKQSRHDFDIRNHNRSMQHHVVNLGVQSRFDSLMTDSDNIEFELQFCSAYYLFHMRRWAEAVTIASGVVDSLVQKAVFSKLAEDMARLLWDKYRTQTNDLFNRVFPALEYEKLADVEQILWKSFQKAKEYRGVAAHGSVANSFDSEQEVIVQKHLKALYSVARWLSIQIGRPWRLDVDANGETLPFF
jgi:hypothetical protein